MTIGKRVRRIGRRDTDRNVRRATGFLLLALATIPAAAAVPAVERISRTDIPAYIDADGSATGPFAVSANGRFVVFASEAGNLVAGDGNGKRDLFVRDLADGSIARLDIGSEPAKLGRAGISGDGRYVVFASTAALTAEPTNGTAQIYRRDRSDDSVTLLSRGSDGLPASGHTRPGNTSADGRYSVFSTPAANLVGGASRPEQVFVHDATTGTLNLVSATPAGLPGNQSSIRPQLSADGRFVLFASSASDLVAGDTNFRIDLFLRDLQLGTTQRVSVSTGGTQLADPGAPWDFGMSCAMNQLSDDGRYAVFYTNEPADPADTNGWPDVYRFDRISGATQRISTSVGSVTPYLYNVCPVISADGQRIVWWSQDGEVPYDSALYLHDLGAGTLRRLLTPQRPDATFSNFAYALPGSGDGVFFASDALLPGSRFSQVYRIDTGSGASDRLSRAPDGNTGPYADGHSGDLSAFASSAVSADGRFVAFTSEAGNLVVGDSNGVADVFLRDRLTGTTQRISARADGSQSSCASQEPAMNPAADFIVFASCGALAAPATGDQPEIYRYERATGAVELISRNAAGARANGASSSAQLSDDGRHVAFVSCATDLTATATTNCQAFVRDVNTAATQLVSRDAAGQPANLSVQSVRIAGGGRHVLFSSLASNLVAGDTNNRFDAFVHDQVSLITERVSVSTGGAQDNGGAFAWSLSADGNLVAFESASTTLVGGIATAKTRVYLRDRAAGTTSLVAIPGDADKTGSRPWLAADGSRLVFVNATANSGVGGFDDSGREKLFLLDRATNGYRALTWYDGDTAAGTTQAPYLSADGRYLTFRSTRSDLDPPDGNGAFTDVFLMVLDDRIFAADFETTTRSPR